MKLQEIRQLRGLSQNELSEATGINIRTIQHYESGYRSIDSAHLETLCSLAMALKCRITDIVEDDVLAEAVEETEWFTPVKAKNAIPLTKKRNQYIESLETQIETLKEEKSSLEKDFHQLVIKMNAIEAENEELRKE